MENMVQDRSAMIRGTSIINYILGFIVSKILCNLRTKHQGETYPRWRQ